MINIQESQRVGKIGTLPKEEREGPAIVFSTLEALFSQSHPWNVVEITYRFVSPLGLTAEKVQQFVALIMTFSRLRVLDLTRFFENRYPLKIQFLNQLKSTSAIWINLSDRERFDNFSEGLNREFVREVKEFNRTREGKVVAFECLVDKVRDLFPSFVPPERIVETENFFVSCFRKLSHSSFLGEEVAPLINWAEKYKKGRGMTGQLFSEEEKFWILEGVEENVAECYFFKSLHFLYNSSTLGFICEFQKFLKLFGKEAGSLSSPTHTQLALEHAAAVSREEVQKASPVFRDLFDDFFWLPHDEQLGEYERRLQVAKDNFAELEKQVKIEKEAAIKNATGSLQIARHEQMQLSAKQREIERTVKGLIPENCFAMDLSSLIEHIVKGVGYPNRFLGVIEPRFMERALERLKTGLAEALASAKDQQEPLTNLRKRVWNFFQSIYSDQHNAHILSIDRLVMESPKVLHATERLKGGPVLEEVRHLEYRMARLHMNGSQHIPIDLDLAESMLLELGRRTKNYVFEVETLLVQLRRQDPDFTARRETLLNIYPFPHTAEKRIIPVKQAEKKGRVHVCWSTQFERLSKELSLEAIFAGYRIHCVIQILLGAIEKIYHTEIPRKIGDSTHFLIQCLLVEVMKESTDMANFDDPMELLERQCQKLMQESYFEKFDFTTLLKYLRAHIKEAMDEVNVLYTKVKQARENEWVDRKALADLIFLDLGLDLEQSEILKIREKINEYITLAMKAYSEGEFERFDPIPKDSGCHTRAVLVPLMKKMEDDAGLERKEGLFLSRRHRFLCLMYILGDFRSPDDITKTLVTVRDGFSTQAIVRQLIKNISAKIANSTLDFFMEALHEKGILKKFKDTNHFFSWFHSYWTGNADRTKQPGKESSVDVGHWEIPFSVSLHWSLELARESKIPFLLIVGEMEKDTPEKTQVIRRRAFWYEINSQKQYERVREIPLRDHKHQCSVEQYSLQQLMHPSFCRNPKEGGEKGYIIMECISNWDIRSKEFENGLFGYTLQDIIILNGIVHPQFSDDRFRGRDPGMSMDVLIGKQLDSLKSRGILDKVPQEDVDQLRRLMWEAGEHKLYSCTHSFLEIKHLFASSQSLNWVNI